MERDEGRDVIDEVPLEFLEVLAPFGEDYRRTATSYQPQRLVGNQLRALVRSKRRSLRSRGQPSLDRRYGVRAGR